MSALIALVPIIFAAVAPATAAAVGIGAAGLGAGLFGSLAAGIGLTGTLGAIVTGAATFALQGGLIGGLTSLVSGGDFLDGVKDGAISGAIGGGLTGGLTSAFGGGPASLDTMGGDVASSLTQGEATSVSAGGLAVPNGASGGSGGFGGDEASLAQGSVGGSVASTGPASTGVASSGAAVGPAAAAPTGTNYGSGGLLDGIFDKQTIGGALAGAGKVLSGDTAKAAQQEQNKGALERQTQGQDYIKENYVGSGGLGLDTNPADAQNGRPQPSQAFAQPGANNVQWEYYYDPTLRSIQKRPVTKPGASANVTA